MITAYHQLSSITRYIKFYNPTKDKGFTCNNNHNNITASYDIEHVEECKNILF
ncbi:MAG: hypothetical protein ACRC41_09195 [Sarcina sp.]